MRLIEIFSRNFIQFDFLIFLLAVAEFLILRRSLKLARQIQKLFYPTGYLPGGRENQRQLARHFDRYLGREGEEEITRQYRRLGLSYSLYENIAALFPLMGILGTVISLIPMVDALDSETKNLFFAALTSTFWGIVFAIIFKGLNGWLAAEINFCEDSVALYLERNTRLFAPSSEHPETPPDEPDGRAARSVDIDLIAHELATQSLPGITLPPETELPDPDPDPDTNSDSDLNSDTDPDNIVGSWLDHY
ncbi:MAG: MotA/TolQ/ExbB proton channel family protein [Bacillota bacterium]|nr:MotA/TolQ/ExbB proton channel family protein [Bacillota bacterium]